MTASDLSLQVPIPDRLRGRLARIPRAPAEGWLTILALALLLVAMAWSIDDPGWIGGDGARTDYLAPIAILAMAIGFVGAKAGWGRWATYLLGAVLAAIVLPLISGDLVLGDAIGGLAPLDLARRYTVAAENSIQAWYDLAILDLPFTREWAHYVIAIGGLVWGTAMYAAYSVFGHRRPLDAVIAVGLVLLTNMAITTHNQLHLMVLASIGGLMLLTRSHAFEEKATWIRRRIGDPTAVTSLYLRGGSAFIAAAILASLTLTATASSKPLQEYWAGVPQRVVTALDWLRKVLPFGGAGGGGVVVFSASAPAQGVWVSDNNVAFTADFADSDEKQKFRWRAATYSDFELNAWSWGSTQADDYDPGAQVLVGLPDDPAKLPGRREVVVTIHPETFQQSIALSPTSIQKVDKPTHVQIKKNSRYFVAVELRELSDYTVTALVWTEGDETSGLTKNRLRVAGDEYPAGIRSTYLSVPAGSLGPDATALLQQIRDRTKDQSAYDKARYVESLLKDSGGFRYNANISGLNCERISMVECFARYKMGYCQYYATEMAILLRSMGIPTRLAQGFLPGPRDASGHEVVRNSNAHAWVEVYFPNYGWVDFDPTGGGQSLDETLPEGSIVPVTPKPSSSGVILGPSQRDDEGRSQSPGGPINPQAPKAGPGVYVAIGLLLLITMAGLAYVAWKRGPRRPMEPDIAWRGVLSIARRFGFGPQPAQTVFEYAGVLGNEVPQVRPELQTVASGKVEVAYGRRLLADDRKRAIAEASRRLRVGLLRLAFRRRGRKRGKGPRAI
jgi:transglutaminase-like putative cysteine protease